MKQARASATHVASQDSLQSTAPEDMLARRNLAGPWCASTLPDAGGTALGALSEITNWVASLRKRPCERLGRRGGYARLANMR